MSAVILASLTDRDGDTISLARHDNGSMGFLATSGDQVVVVGVLREDVDALADFASACGLAAAFYSDTAA